MNVFNEVRRKFVCLVALGLAVCLIPSALAAPGAGPMQTRGGVRGDNGQTLRITVKLGEKPLVNLKVAIKITTADGTVVASGTTSNNGVYSTALDAGTYTVTTTTARYTGTGNVTIEQSTSPAMLTIHLEKKAAAPAPATTTATTPQ